MYTGRPIRRSRRSEARSGKINPTQLRGHELAEEKMYPRAHRRSKRKDAMLATTQVCKDPMLLWAGNQSVSIEIADCCFAVRYTKLASGQGTWAVYLTAASTTSELADLVGVNIYLTPGSIRSPLFRSPFPEDSEAYHIQKRLWSFLDRFFLKAIIKPVPVLMPEEKIIDETSGSLTLSGELLRLLRGYVGRYSFECVAPRAIFMVGAIQDEYDTPVVELMTVDEGHMLFGYCKEGTRIPLSVLTQALNYSFRGPRAQDMEEIWLYILGLVTLYGDADQRIE